jgi:hypothetical protein
MLSSKDIEHNTIKHNRTIVETYTHKVSGWRLKVWTSYSAPYKAMQTHIQEIKVDGNMELPIDGGIFKRVSSLRCSKYSDKALVNAHREGEVMAMINYGEHIKIDA